MGRKTLPSKQKIRTTQNDAHTTINRNTFNDKSYYYFTTNILMKLNIFFKKNINHLFFKNFIYKYYNI